ncbi:MerR family transcriptional regulator [Halobacillus sp. BAB-2008]|uniref:MerR family transcriptional regulator n=1 Tax=Halobacillus sp. BAB-2008 TaxID=1246484 RepID=UPI0002A4DC94|nr:MerR family transcriptional regulator [Halobacillus sp. BAB-2008]ELK46507.1 multidrug-efflux transporter genes transcriptional regulator [Halobacillus sp. BAB-2008]
MKRKFTIGQMSKLHNLPVKTLRYYDEIDLFKPHEVDKRTGYRYYSIDQFEHLNTIHYLRELGIPLKEIKDVFDRRDVDFFYHLLKRQEEEADRQIKALQKVRRRARNRKEELQWAKQLQTWNVPIIKRIPERHILEWRECIRTKEELELALRSLENKCGKRASIFIGGVALTADVEEIKAEDTYAHQSLLLLSEEMADGPHAAVLPDQEYVCLYCKEKRVTVKDHYETIFHYLNEEGYEVNGEAIERVIIDDYVTKNPEEYLSEIQIPVRKIQ